MNYLSIPGAQAAEDLSSYQYKAVQVTTTDWRVGPITNANAPQVPIGILQNDPDTAGHPADVAIVGVCKAECATTVTAGDNLAVNNSGEVTPDDETTTSSDLYHIGVALEDGVDGQVIQIVLLPFGLQGVE